MVRVVKLQMFKWREGFVDPILLWVETGVSHSASDFLSHVSGTGRRIKFWGETLIIFLFLEQEILHTVSSSAYHSNHRHSLESVLGLSRQALRFCFLSYSGIYKLPLSDVLVSERSISPQHMPQLVYSSITIHLLCESLLLSPSSIFIPVLHTPLSLAQVKRDKTPFHPPA